MSKTGSPNGTAERAFALVDALARDDALTLTELAAEAGLTLSTASRLVVTLEKVGVIQRHPRAGLLSLGPRCILYGAAALNATPLYRAARSIAHDLSGELGLGVNVAFLNEDMVTYALNVEGRSAPRAISLAGRTQPAHATGLGKALISELAETRLAEVVGAEPFPAFTPFTITMMDALTDALTAVRQCGYATEIEELAFGRACIAAPIRAAHSAVAGAISISGPLRTLDPDSRLQELSGRVVDAADTIAAALDFEPARHVALRG